MMIRPSLLADVIGLQRVVEATGLFPAEMLPEMMGGTTPASTESRWLTCEKAGEVVGFCYAVPETFAEGTWNMLAIAVLPEMQGQALGSALVRALEAELRREGHRILIVDTSGTSEFARTRAFYRNNGYAEEATIRDFWAPGDDKVTFWKSLT